MRKGNWFTCFIFVSLATISSFYISLNFFEHYSFFHQTAQRSPFYGMEHRETYGMPLSYFGKNSFKIKREDWKKFAPKFAKAVNQYKSIPDDPKFFTQSASIKVKKSEYEFGDEFVAVVTSHDGEGKAKKFGGDYYRARLIRGNTDYPDGIPCRVIDNENGTYTVKAPLVLEGDLILEVRLVQSIEGTMETIKQTETMIVWSTDFNATFETLESDRCNVNLTDSIGSEKLPLCDYSNPRNGEPWFCVQPKSQTCPKIIDLKFLGKDKNMNFLSICDKYGCQRNVVHYSIKVGAKKSEVADYLRSCSADFSRVESFKRTSGYIDKKQWKLLHCSKTLESLNGLRNCWKNKIIYFFGDSTIRQFFYLASYHLGLKIRGPDNSRIWQQPQVAFDHEFWQITNTTLYYRAHGPPLLNPGPPESRPYISDSIMDIPVGGNGVYVIFNIGAHLFFYHPSVYIHRLRGIKNAILKHHRKFPETKFLLRGLNVVQMTYEWNIYRMELILRKIFEDMRNVVFVNLWDVGTVWPLNDYHPDNEMLQQQALLLFKCACSKESLYLLQRIKGGRGATKRD